LRNIVVWRKVLKWWIALWWMSFVHICGAQSASAPLPVPAEPVRLALHDPLSRHDLWPFVRIWTEPEGAPLTPAGALAHAGEFQPPHGRSANLGRQRAAVWLRTPVLVTGTEDGHWLFEADYPALDRIDLYLMRDGQVARHEVLGDSLPFSARPLPTRGHVVELQLDPGVRYDLLLRVQTTSTMVLPLSLVEMHRYQYDESRVQMLQGLLAGLAACLLLYSLSQWVSLRDAVYGWYALSVFGIGTFFLAFFGVGAQFIWGEQVWLTDRAPPLAVLIGLIGGTMFIARSLQVRQLFPWISLALRIVAAVAVVVSVAFLAGLVDYPTAHQLATVLGPAPMLLGVPVAWVRWRSGDRAAGYIFLGWGIYAVGVLTMVLLMEGWVAANFWTQHAFQFASMLEMVTWMFVLGVRTDAIRTAAEQAQRDRDRMESLAHTDPLTGVLNRRGLQVALQPLLDSADPVTSQAVFALDLDGFKPVNDTYGHDVGDTLLIEVARRLRSVLRSQDLVARTGGDEFIVVTPGLHDARQAELIGRKLLRVFNEEFTPQDCRCRVGVTIGYAVAPTDGSDAASLLRNADAAMYQGKQAGKRQLRRAA
jgi:diguanylate cyclase (GGDEF)-like protein